jgi:hypothetical protein
MHTKQQCSAKNEFQPSTLHHMGNDEAVKSPSAAIITLCLMFNADEEVRLQRIPRHCQVKYASLAPFMMWSPCHSSP